MTCCRTRPGNEFTLICHVITRSVRNTLHQQQFHDADPPSAAGPERLAVAQAQALWLPASFLVFCLPAGAIRHTSIASIFYNETRVFHVNKQ